LLIVTIIITDYVKGVKPY